MEINYEDFKKVSIKVGTVLEVKKNEKVIESYLGKSTISKEN